MVWLETQMRRQGGVLFVLLLLLCEILWLLARMQLVVLPFYDVRAFEPRRGIVGSVLRIRKDLKRRGSNSLVWETSKDQDTLYYQDSVLTLSQSSAILFLNDQTELHLSENTLVSLEKPEGKTSSEIRLRFSKGDLRARNPSQASKIQDQGWTVTVEKGSEISVHKDDENVEIEVLQGKARLQGDRGDENLGEHEILRLESGHAQKNFKKLQKSEEIQWQSPLWNRIYVFGETAEVPLEWKGEASEIHIQKPGQSTMQVTLQSSERSHKIPLGLGNYVIRLQGASGLSAAANVEVWKAPHILLQRPLPRDRLTTHDNHDFIWSWVPEVREYRVFGFSENGKYISTAKNFTQIQKAQESDVLWKVEGVDSDGFSIPAFYENEVYFRDHPLEAPRLRPPQIQKPTMERERRGAWGWNRTVNVVRVFFAVFSLEESRAKELPTPATATGATYDATFRWDPVEGANQYIIEISRTPDFRDVEVTKTVRDSQFVWKKISTGTFYWRVASGHTGGRMGLFSEPLELRLDDSQISQNEITDLGGVLVKKKKSPQRAPVSVSNEEQSGGPPTQAPPSEAPLAEASPAETAHSNLPPRRLETRWSLAWAPELQWVDLRSEGSLHANQQGFHSGSLEGDIEIPKSENDYTALSFWATRQTWSPRSEAEFPFQRRLAVQEAGIHWEQGSLESGFRWGGTLHQTFIPDRIDGEALSMKALWLLGPRISYQNFQKSLSSSEAGLSLLTSGGALEVLADLGYQRILFQLTSEIEVFMGVHGQGSYLLQRAGAGEVSQIRVLFGLTGFP